MKVRITGIGNKSRNYFTSRVFDLSNTLEMSIAIGCWKKEEGKYDKLEVVDAKTGKTPIGDPFENLAYFYAHVK